MNILRLYTFGSNQTGNLSRTPALASEFGDIRGSVLECGGAVPGKPGWTFALQPEEGFASFEISKGAVSYVLCGVAWSQSRGDAGWQFLRGKFMAIGAAERAAMSLRGPADPPISQPSSLPWLAAMFLPSFLKSPVPDPTALIWIARFEQHISWTVLDTYATQPH